MTCYSALTQWKFPLFYEWFTISNIIGHGPEIVTNEIPFYFIPRGPCGEKLSRDIAGGPLYCVDGLAWDQARPA